MLPKFVKIFDILRTGYEALDRMAHQWAGITSFYASSQWINQTVEQTNKQQTTQIRQVFDINILT